MKIAIILGAVILFSVLCVIGFFLLRRTLYNMIDRRIERFQSELIEKQVLEIQNMYRQVRDWRHDYRNHIQNMKIQLAQGNYAELDSYLDSLADDLNTVDTVIKTGNVMADAILNRRNVEFHRNKVAEFVCLCYNDIDLIRVRERRPKD